MIQLRETVLRRPLGLTYSHDELAAEKDDILIACTDDDEMLGCCILTKINNDTIRLRQMAVPDKLHGKGIGASIINFAENLAKDKGYRCITMHSRDTAIGFYEHYCYKINGTPVQEVTLQHHVLDRNCVYTF